MSQSFRKQLVSPRLRLRRLQREDVAALCAYRGLPAVARYQSWESFGPVEAAHLIESQSEAEPGIPGTWFQMAIVETASGCVIGDCGLHCLLSDPRQMEIGITLAPDRQGRGYASETVICLLDYFFGTLGKHRVIATTDVLNRPAIALFRRLGFRQEAHLMENVWFKGRWGSEYIFAMLQCEWEAKQP